MTPQIIVRPRADWDVDEQVEHIEASNPAAARRFLAAVQDSFRRLADMPGLGSLCEFTNPRYANLRQWPVRRFKNHVIFYRPVEAGIEIVRVLHAARDIKSFFE